MMMPLLLVVVVLVLRLRRLTKCFLCLSALKLEFGREFLVLFMMGWIPSSAIFRNLSFKIHVSDIYYFSILYYVIGP